MAGLQAMFGSHRIGHRRDPGDQPLGDAADLLGDLRIRVDRLLLLQDLLERLQAHRLLVLGRDALVDQHGLAGQRVGAAVGEVVIGRVAGEQHQDQQARVEATSARSLLVLPVAERILVHRLLLRFVLGYYNCRTSRKPTRALVTSTPPAARHAERDCAGALAQEPPRYMRLRQPGLTQATPVAGARR